MPHLFLFLAAAFALAITPGPGMFYVVGRTWAAGRRDGLASSLGTMLGGFVHVTACVVGVSALVMASASAFTVLKLVGGVYLVYLGIQTFRAASREAMTMPEEAATGWVRAFRQGVVVEATNPKTAAFFLAFIPQFIDMKHEQLPQVILLGATFMVVAGITDGMYAVLAGRARALMSARRTQLISRISGSLMIGGGIWLALTRAR